MFGVFTTFTLDLLINRTVTITEKEGVREAALAL